jgi:HemY protein
MKTWKLSPHPDLALVYAFARPGEPPRERVKRVEQLASLVPGDPEGPIAVAVAAIEAHEWQAAREALAPYLEDRPPARICALMARIEAGQGDMGREREWLARAVRAPRDRAWIADGYVSDRWLPVSPVTGAVDAFQWKAPVDAIGRGDDTLLIEDRALPVAVPEAIEAAAPAEPADEKSWSERPQAATVTEAETIPPPTQPRPKPAVFVPSRPPDDPGVAQGETDEAPNSLERIRTAQIR